MQKKILLILSIMFISSIVAGCGQNAQTQENKILKAEKTIAQQTDEIITKMSVEEKVGQLLMFGLPKEESISDKSLSMLQNDHIGGVILFDRNMHSKEQVKSDIAKIQRSMKNYAPVPLLIGIDQEGGLVTRMPDKLVHAPSAEILGERNIADAVEWADKSARELSALGFNLNFAPVVDLGLPYHRSYGKTPDKVISYAKEVGEAYETEGLLFTLKHFQGIGKADSDLHQESNTIGADKATLENQDMRPFKTLIKDFNNPWGYLIMVSHAKYPAFDKENPASLSKVLINDVLRKEMGYKGVIITDDMEMGAVANHYSFAQMSVKAINAGVDIVLICHAPKHMQQAYDALLTAVKSGEISRKTLDEAVYRIIYTKINRGIIW